MDSKKTRTVHPPELLGVVMRCKNKHVLPGLFVIYRVLPDPPPGAASCGLAQLWSAHRSLLCELVPPPDGLPDARYALAFSDRRGYLEPVGAADDPWRRFYGLEKPSPHQPKIASRGTYSCYLVRHPSVDRARDLLRVLNGEAAAGADTSLAAEQRIVPVVETLDGNKRQLVLELDEDPRCYAPRGGELYGGWLLYRDMPHAECQPVQEAVKKLQAHLGALRYPVGAQESPYLPRAVAPAKDGRQASASRFYINPAVHSTILAFQDDHRERHVAKVRDKARCHGSSIELGSGTRLEARDGSGKRAANASAESSWAYLDTVPLPEAESDGLARQPAITADGVVDSRTAAAIALWLENGYRKPGIILVDVDPNEGPVTWHLYMRGATAMRVKAWREVIKAMGCKYGLRSGHSFRDVLNGVAAKKRGVLAMSLHKSGAAIDLGVSGSDGEIRGTEQEDYSKPIASWPVLFERKVYGPHKPVKDGSLQRSSIGWRLYGHSSIDGAQLGTSGAGAQELETSLLEARDRLLDYFIGRIGRDPLEVSDPDIQRVAREIFASCLALMAALHDDHEQFARSYFRPTVTQWRYDPFSAEGGTRGPTVRPQDPVLLDYANPAAHTIVPGRGRSFLNFSALARRFGMLRISAQSSGWQDEAADEAGRAVYRPQQAISVKGNFGYLVGMLRKLAGSEHRSLPIEVDTGSALFTFTVDEIDLDFAEQWAIALKEVSGELPHRGATVSVRLGIPPRDKAARSFAARLGSIFATNHVQCTDGIALAWGGSTLRVDTGEIATGAEWQRRIEDMLDKLATWRSARGAQRSEPKSEREWTIELHPQLVDGSGELIGQPDQYILLPARGTGRALEWWHYQDIDANGQSWIQLMTAIGYSRAALSNESAAELYYRPGIGYPPSRPATYDAKGNRKRAAIVGWDAKHGASTDEVENWPNHELDQASLPPPMSVPPATSPRPVHPYSGKKPASHH